MPRKFDFLSPGIEITEVDQSILPAEVDADGPVIIGRFRKGPGMKPVKIRSLDAFISVYGNPVPGGSSLQGDIWRDGPQLSAPTYAAYAAQAWLASRTSPVNIVRLLGDEHPQATGATGNAGWQLSASIPSSTAADNSTAYGLFVIDKTKTGTFTHIALEAHAGLTVANLETETSKLSLSSGSLSHNTAQGGSNSFAADVRTRATGLMVEVNFNVDNATTAGNVTRAATGGGSDTSVPLLTIDLHNTSSTAEILGFISDALNEESARSDSFLEELGFEATATQVKISNFSLTKTFILADVGTTQDNWQADAVDKDNATLTNGNLKDVAAFVRPATVQPGEGALAAIFYVDSGYLGLVGKDGTGTDVTQAEALVESEADNIGFKIQVYDKNQVATEAISFNFNRNSKSYIREQFNTNPQKVNSGVTDSDDLKTYWLGESYERHLKTKVTTTTAGNQYGVLLPLQKGNDASAAKSNWSYHRVGSQEAKSGWIIDYDRKDATNYDARSMTKLFRFESLHAGEEIQKSILIAIEDLKLATNSGIYAYGTFTVKVMDMNGGTLEKYTLCNLDPNSPNFVARRIGDMYMEWSETDRRYRSYGNHPNVSDYIRIKMYDEEQNYDAAALPAGFYGPGMPKGFGALGAHGKIKSLNLGSDFTGSFSKGASSVPIGGGTAAIDLGNQLGAKFTWPSIPLRINGSDGFSANPYRVYFGVRPKVDANSSLHDEDYVDYVRMLPSYYRTQAHNVTDSGFDYSFVFSLDDIKIDTTTNSVTYASGSRQASSNKSYTATNSFSELLDKDVKQFVVPLFGGFDGLNIKEKESFNFDDIQATTTDTTNYLVYSLNKALDSVADPETVPASLLSIPGIKNTHITDKIIRTAESRKDMLAVVDLVGDYTPSFESRDSQSTRLGSVVDTISNIKNRQINSSFAAAYYPAVQIQDNLNNGERVWVPSSVAGLGAMAQSDASAELWFAPAGFNRGGLGSLGGRSGPRVIQARQRLDSSERDKLYEVNINPIATFPNEGVVVFGQKTLQQTPSALDRINVRRLMIFLKAEISKVAQGILFDNNVRSTWSRFVAEAEPILADVKAKFGLTEYRLILDSSTTTADLIDRNILYAKVFLKPARAIEFIAIDFVITRTGADFA